MDARLGAVYRCPICGAECALIRKGAAAPAPRCCNVDMKLTGRVNPVYRCEVCGAEAMIIAEGGGAMEPVCCNAPMGLLAA